MLEPRQSARQQQGASFRRRAWCTAAEAELLRDELIEAAQTNEVALGELDMFGQRYTIDFEMMTERGTGLVRSGWIILHSENNPRLTTCYVLKR